MKIAEPRPGTTKRAYADVCSHNARSRRGTAAPSRKRTCRKRLYVGGVPGSAGTPMAVPGGTLVEAFAAVGWKGGRWRASPDWQHFSATGG
jgi:hypothetical protein